MTDKQIIDNIDVSECSYYADGKCTNSHIVQSNCKNVAVCYYKEYKRKEQECKELKDITHRNFLHAPEEQKRADKYFKTLTKIKGIAEEYAHNCDFSWECEKCDYSCFSKQILQKISESEE